MKNIIRNTWLIFKRNKEFFYLITIQPIIIFFLMSFLLSYSTSHNISVINQDNGEVGQRIYDTLAEMDGVDMVDITYEDAAAKVLSGNIELAVVVGEKNTASLAENGTSDIQLITTGNSEVEDTVKLAINQTVNGELSGTSSGTMFESNEVKSKWITISYSLGIMIFKTLTAGNLLAALIIRERNNKMKDRILLSGTKTSTYLGGMSIVYTLCMMVGSVIYYVAAYLLNFDFGMKNSLGFLLMLFTANILAVALYLFASTLVKKEDSLWFMATFVLLPMALFSGVLFPFQLMPEIIQKIGNCLPQRWIIGGIEHIQQTGQISSALPNIALVLGLSAVLYVLASIRTRRS
ncbi:MAG: ABC transporter permease [Lachnospiraceae bacterium]